MSSKLMSTSRETNSTKTNSMKTSAPTKTLKTSVNRWILFLSSKLKKIYRISLSLRVIMVISLPLKKIDVKRREVKCTIYLEFMDYLLRISARKGRKYLCIIVGCLH